MITLSRHPLYWINDYIRFRLTYFGGRRFVDGYLRQVDAREDKNDFERRKSLTYNPNYAAEVINEIMNSIYQRMPEIGRTGGTKSYNRAVQGLDGGVDLETSSMNAFIGQQVLREMLIMGRTGIYVDMPKFNPYSTLAMYKTEPHPYCYYYYAEDILNWKSMYIDNELVHTVILLREQHWENNSVGLPDKQKDIFRLVQLKEDGVLVSFYEQAPDPTSAVGVKENMVKEIFLAGFKRIPFVMMDIGMSLMTELSDMQVTLLNLASADVNYLIESNFPFYVEGYDSKTDNNYTRSGLQTVFDPNTGNTSEVPVADGSSDSEITVGTMRGRRYPYQAPSPAFIAPSTEPIKASMAKQEQIKSDMRRILNLAVANIDASRQSADSKIMDKAGLESGLAAIGLELQGAEQEVAQLWAQYEGQDVSSAITISYPTSYELKSDPDRTSEATELIALQGAAPSITFQKEISKQVVKKLLDGRVNAGVITKIYGEVDKADYITSNAADIAQDVLNGLVDKTTASCARGYDGEKVVPIAEKEHTQRLAEIAKAQTAASAKAGAAQGANDPMDGRDRKTADQDPDKQPTGKDGKRGAVQQ